MRLRARYYLYLLAGIVWLIVPPVGDYFKRTSTAFGSLHIKWYFIVMAATFFGLAIKAKKELPRQR